MAWGYTTNARPGPRGGKGQPGEKVGTELGMGEWRRAQQSRTGAEICQHSGKMGRKGPVTEGGETACSLLIPSLDIICYSIFIPQELICSLPSPWPTEHPPSSLMLTPSGAFHPGRKAPQHTQAEGEGENIFGLTCFCYLVNRDPKLLGHVSQNGEDGKSCQDAGDGIAQGHYEGVPTETDEDALNTFAPSHPTPVHGGIASPRCQSKVPQCLSFRACHGKCFPGPKGAFNG